MDILKENLQNYRFKTEKEFKDEFGENWRAVVPSRFPIEMDHLLGKDINVAEVDMINSYYNCYNTLPNNLNILFGYKTWSISKEMITKKEPVVNYNDLLI